MIAGPYSIPVPGPVVYQRGADNVTSLVVEGRDAELVVPSSATLTLVSPSGASVASPTCSVSGAGVVSATVVAADLPSTLGYGEGYSERWTVTISGTAYALRRPAVVARFGLFPPHTVTEAVAGEYPDLRVQMGGYESSLGSIFAGAWEECVRYLWRQGVAPTTVENPSQVVDWYRHLALARVWKGLLSTQENDRFRFLFAYHDSAATAARDGLRVTIADPSTALVTDEDPKPVARQVHPNRVGRAYVPRCFG